MRKSSVLLGLSVVLFVFGAHAQITKKQIRDAAEGLKNASPDVVLANVNLLAQSGSKQAVQPLIDLLKTGPRNDITDATIQALGSIADPQAVNILVEYLSHRRSDARIAVIYALQSFGTPQSISAIENALRDSDKQVRATAVLALGKTGKKESVTILFKAFERGVNDAAIAIGQLGTPDDSERLATYLGKSDIKVLLSGFDEFLRRPDFPEKAKLKILERLFDLAGPDVRRFSVAYKASFPPETSEDSNELFKMASRMVRQIQED